ncbi:unnamed protein product [Zymoseptoria tritici ST99CH_3D7]|uniref:GST N-terminal domain-containing protein n=1 Tax=Zymoseptoria tritici (strain ST99CH_3D7) TaxID=1276538 RepID=A0A1X7RMU9_ZYMT9|nr:unnamed protein product [Zymoseptoria tritici ST99CH_3D7]
MATATAPKIVFYTNHGCPYAHRADITLRELDLPYEEVLIDLDSPRPQWYLDINPRGLVPAMKFTLPDSVDQEQIITESGVVAQFLCDAFPSHLLPATTSPADALTRARIAFFHQTWTDKVSPAQMAILRAATEEERDAKSKETVQILKKEIEPLLSDAAPFFGGSAELTFAEVMCAPFVMRLLAMAEDGELVPQALKTEMEKLPNVGRWTKAILGHEKATRVFEKEKFNEAVKSKLDKIRGVKM